MECLPVVYTPTVGQACQEYSHIFRKPQGMYLSFADKGNIRKVLDNWGHEVDIIVVTDGGRILGLGDLGANGMGIPVGKLALYVAGGGFNPINTLPIQLDLGCNIAETLEDPMYMGARHSRHYTSTPAEKPVEGGPKDLAEYYEYLAEFVNAIKDKWPKCLLQFEDFATENAFDLLDQHKESCRCFNDDIQGTGSVILAGWISSLEAQGTDPTKAKVVFYGAGSAAIGCADTIVAYLTDLGMSEEDARANFWLIDSKGLITTNRGDKLADYKVPYARKDMDSVGGGGMRLRGKESEDRLLEIIKTVQPDMLMGLAGSGPAFKESHIKEMLTFQPKPVIFPLSNPTSKAEITAVDAYTWTDGKCIFAAGSPFDPVELNGRTYYPGQGNNMFIFPGIGFGAWLCQASKVSDKMFTRCAKAVAKMVTPEEIASGLIYPKVEEVVEVCKNVAIATIETAFEEGIAGIEKPADIAAFVVENMWVPSY